MDFSHIRFTHISPLARRIFSVEGVTRVFYGSDFVSIGKTDEEQWTVLRPLLLEILTDHFSKSLPLFTEERPPEDTQILEDDSEAVAMIKEIIETRIRPFVQEDGGDVAFHGFDEEDGVVHIAMKGSCSGCPSSNVTLKNGIENMLKHYVAEVQSV